MAAAITNFVWKACVGACFATTVVGSMFVVVAGWKTIQANKQIALETGVTGAPSADVLQEESTIRSDLLEVERRIGFKSFREE